VEFHAFLRHPLTGDVLAATTVAVSDYHSPARELLYSMHVHTPLLMRAAGLLLCSGCLPKVCVSATRPLQWAGPLARQASPSELSPVATPSGMLIMPNLIITPHHYPRSRFRTCRCMCNAVHPSVSPLTSLPYPMLHPTCRCR